MRCKCCNNIMQEHEIIWYESIKQHEDLCLSCRYKLRDELRDESVIDAYNSDDDIINRFVEHE